MTTKRTKYSYWEVIFLTVGSYAFGLHVGKNSITWEALGLLYVSIGLVTLIMPRLFRSEWMTKRIDARLSKEFDEFMKAFPTCSVCGLYEFGLVHELEKPGTRPEHVCQRVVPLKLMGRGRAILVQPEGKA